MSFGEEDSSASSDNQWHDFTILDQRTLLLKGDYSQNSEKYNEQNRGKQCSANAIMAIVYSRINSIKDWKRQTLNEILDEGDRLYAESLETDGLRKMSPVEVNSEFQTSNVNVIIQVGKASKIAPPSVGRYIIDFFKTFTAGVITVSNKSYAIWKDEQSYYFFTPHATDDKGRRSKRGNSCALFRLADISRLLEVIRQNVTANQVYELVKVDLLKVAKKEEEEKKQGCILAQVAASPQKRRPKSINQRPCSKSPKNGNRRAPSLDMAPPRLELKEYEDIMEQQLSCSRPPKKANFPKNAMTNETQLDLTQPEFQSPIECMNASLESSFQQSTDGAYEVVLGTIHIHLFEDALELTQAANIIAIVMLRFFNSIEWEAATLDDILETAEQTYKYVANNRKKLSLSDYKNAIILKCQQFRLKVKEIATAGRLSSRDPNVQDLFPALIDFFTLYDSGIIQGPTSVAIWQEQSTYYMYDPFECDANGRRIHSTMENAGDACSRGASCLSKFKRIQDLADVYIGNLHQRQRKKNFIVSSVEVMDQKGAPTPWHQWLGINKGVWIIRADFSQASNKFGRDSQNRQCTCMAAMAIAHTKMVPMQDWSTEVMNNILQSGDEYYRQCIQHLRSVGQYKHPHLMVSELFPETTILDTQIRFCTCDCLIYGLLTAHDDDVVPSLKTGLRMFFGENDSGIVTARCISVAVWRAKEVYYYCDSHCRDHRGRSKDGGTACVLRFLTIDSLASLLQSNFPAGSENMFNIGKVSAEAVKIACEPNAFRMPPKFTEIKNEALPLYAILRSDIHEGWKGFDNRRNRQTICNIAQAMAVARVIKTSDWGVNVVESILVDGDKMFDKILTEQDGGEDFEVTVDSFNSPIQVGSNWLVMSKDCEINAVFHNGSDMKGDKSHHRNVNQVSLRDVLQGYFKCGCGEDLKFAILISYVVTLALWKDDDGYYIFDPKACDRKGSMSRRRSLDAKTMMLELIGALGCNTKSILEIGSDNEEDGSNYSACVLWFPSIDSMYKKILVNVPIECTEEMVVLVPVHIKNHLIPAKLQAKSPQGGMMGPECRNAWNNFLEIENELYIIRANISQSSNVFVEIPNRGNQDLTNSVAAMAYASCQNCSGWNTRLLDVILHHGDNLYKRLHKRMSKVSEFVRNLDPWKNKFIPDNLTNISMIISNFKIKFEFIEDIVIGDINAKDDNPKVLSVRRGLHKFFNQDEGVSMMITCKYYTTAFWKTDEDAFYMFDPHGCGPNGRLYANGTACCLRSICLQKLSEIYQNNVQKFMEDWDFLDMSGSYSICEVRVWLDKTAAPNKRAICPLAVLQADKCKPNQGDGRRVNDCGYGIIHGSMSLESPCLQYKQALPHLITSIALAQIQDPLSWTKDEMDEVLIAGNNLITDTLNYSQCPLDPECMQLTDLNTELILRDSLIRYSVEETEAQGPTVVQSEYYIDLQMGIETFFMSYDYGVLITDDLKLALWRKPNMQKFVRMYFVYIPYSTDVNGGIRPDGPSALLMLPSTTLVYKYIERNINLQKECSGYAIYAINMCISKNIDATDSGISSPEISILDNSLFEPPAMSTMMAPETQVPKCPTQFPVSKMSQPVGRSRQRIPRLTTETGQMFPDFYQLQSPSASANRMSLMYPPTGVSRIPISQARQRPLSSESSQVAQMCQFPPAACPSQPTAGKSRRRACRLTNKPSQMFAQFYPMQTPTKASDLIKTGQSCQVENCQAPTARGPAIKPQSAFLQQNAAMFPNFYPYQQLSPSSEPNTPPPGISPEICPPASPCPSQETETLFERQYPSLQTGSSQFDTTAQSCPIEGTPVFQRDVPRPRRLFRKYRRLGKIPSAMFPEFINLPPPKEVYSPTQYTPSQQSVLQNPRVTASPEMSEQSSGRQTPTYNVMLPTCPKPATAYKRGMERPQRMFRSKYRQLSQAPSAMFPEFVNMPSSRLRSKGQSQGCPTKGNFQTIPGGGEFIKADACERCASPEAEALPICVVALAMSTKCEPKAWSEATLKTILKAGEVLYRDCTLFYGTEKLTLDTILRTFKIDNKPVEIAVYEATYKGYVCKTEMKGAIVNFFREEQTGVILASKVYLAIMQRAQLFYCFDPNGNERSIYLYRYSKTDQVVSYVLDKCLKSADPAATLGTFSIVPIRILN